MAFLAAENENRQLEDLPQADCGRVPERFLLSVRTKSTTENFVYWKLRPFFCFCSVLTHFFILNLSAYLLYDLFGNCRSFYFHSLIKLTFHVSKGLLCIYDKQNNIWLLVGMKFLFSYSTRHLTCWLRSLVSYRGKHSTRNSISTRAHVLFFIYHQSYQSLK